MSIDSRARICKPFKEPRNRFPCLAGRYANPSFRTGPPGHIGWRLAESIHGLLKCLQIRTLLTTQSVHNLPQSVLYHKILPPSMLRPATGQARLHGVLVGSQVGSLCVGQRHRLNMEEDLQMRRHFRPVARLAVPGCLNRPQIPR